MIARLCSLSTLWLSALWRDADGAVVIETAIVIPALALLSLGGFEVSNIVARQNELQSSAAEAAQIALAAKPDTAQEVLIVKAVIRESTGLAADQVSMSTVYRCEGDTDGYVTSTDLCAEGAFAWQYLQITMTDTYTPIWTSFGVGEPMDFNVTRNVLVAGD